MKSFVAALAGLVVLFASSSAVAGSAECARVFNPPKQRFFGLFGAKPQQEHTMDEMKARSSVSMRGTQDRGEINEGMLPRGSALITSSGALKQTGIVSIIHAASGAMTRTGGHYEPTLESVKLSVANSIALAEKNSHLRIAIPLIGGGIFLQRMGVSPAQLAAEIIKAARASRSMIEVRFVAFAEADVQAFRDGWKIVEREDYRHMDGMEINQGSITEFNVHRASAIVNAANTEVRFGGDGVTGGGLAGAIGRATGDFHGINAEAAEVIASLRR